MTRRSSKANNSNVSRTPKEKRWKDEPENEPFRSLEELKEEFARLKGAGFRSLGELTKDFRQQQERPKISEAAHRAMEVGHRTPGTGVVKKAFEDRGFGFISPDAEDGYGDVFLHFSDIINERNLGVGTRVRYVVEFDMSSGRLRAKNVMAISDSMDAQEESNVVTEDHARDTEVCPPLHTNSYNRDVMLSLYKAMAAHPVSFERVAELKITTVPMPSQRNGAEQDPHLDDEHLIARLEARLDKESGADARNMETFGACSGWTFEEALKANAKLKESQDFEESTAGASSRESPSTSEDNIDVSNGSRQMWECEETRLSWGDGVPKVFQ